MAGISGALKRTGGEDTVRERLAGHRRNLIPARAASLTAADRVDLFVRMAEEVQATVARVGSPEDVPRALADYLAGHNLPSEIVMAPDPALDAYPWQEVPLLSIRRGRAEDADAVSVTGAAAAIAETGTLMLTSGALTPASLHLMPDTHIVVLRADGVVATYEDAWDRIRAALPRTATFVTGPSRTGDIEQRIQLARTGRAGCTSSSCREPSDCQRKARVGGRARALAPHHARRDARPMARASAGTPAPSRVAGGGAGGG